MRSLALLLSALLLGACAPTTEQEQDEEAGASEALEEARKPLYLALGDSVVFGSDPNVPRYTQPHAYHSYPEKVAGALRLRLVNAACPGQTTSGFLSRSGGDLGCFHNLRAGLSLKVDWGGASQLEFAERVLRENPQTRLVTLQIGANDLVSTMFTCGDAYTGCVENKRYTEVPGALLEARANLRKILQRIRGVYEGPLVIVNYYSTDYGSTITTGAIRILNAAIRSEATRPEAHALVADVFNDFQTASSKGGKCLSGLLAATPDCASLDPRSPTFPVDYCKAPLEDPKLQPCNTHPSPAGHARIADVVLETLDTPRDRR